MCCASDTRTRMAEAHPWMPGPKPGTGLIARIRRDITSLRPCRNTSGDSRFTGHAGRIFRDRVVNVTGCLPDPEWLAAG